MREVNLEMIAAAFETKGRAEVFEKLGPIFNEALAEAVNSLSKYKQQFIDIQKDLGLSGDDIASLQPFLDRCSELEKVAEERNAHPYERPELSHFPRMLEKLNFTDDGYVETDNGLLVPAYVASQFGFNSPGREFLEKNLYPKLREAGIEPLCPFTACGEYVTEDMLDEELSIHRNKEANSKFAQIACEVNYRILMPKSKIIVAHLDGSHAIDDGLSSEVAYFATMHGPTVGIRSDMRLHESATSGTNFAVKYFFEQPGCGYFFGQKAEKEALDFLKTYAKRIMKK